jgi:hypothetical protein
MPFPDIPWFFYVPPKTAQRSVGQILILASYFCPKSPYFWIIIDDSNVPEIKNPRLLMLVFFFRTYLVHLVSFESHLMVSIPLDGFD